MFHSGYSWFAGYMNEEQAKESLRKEKGGAFLIRFNTPTGFLLSKKSSDVDSVVEFAIEVSVSVCFIHYGRECMKYHFRLEVGQRSVKKEKNPGYWIAV